jgi:mono/diheme cytochrome c family protein
MNPRTLTILSMLTLALSPLWLQGGCKKEGDTASPGDAGSGKSADAEIPDTGPSEAAKDWEDPLADLDKGSEDKPKMSLDEQLERGEEIYDSKCAGCHKEDGSGKGKIPAVMGGAGLPIKPPKRAKKRKMQFETAADVRAFVAETMPPKKPGSLEEEDYDAVVVFLLRANAIDVTEAFGYHNADQIAIPARDDL